MGFLRQDVRIGHPNFGKLVRCNHPSHAPEQRQRLAALSNLRDSDTRKRLADLKPTPDNRAMLAAATQFLENPRGWLYLHGGPGNAKSELLIALVNELNAAGHGPAMYVKFTQLINWMREAFSTRKQYDSLAAAGKFDHYNDATYVNRFEKIKGIRVLAIDELDKARMTEFATEFQFDVLDERYRSALDSTTVTIFASNTAPIELPAPIRSRVMDGRFTVVHNPAGDARPQMKWRTK